MTQPTITLTPKAIRKAAVAQLVLRDVAGGNVRSAMSRPFTTAEAPAVNVFSPGNSGQHEGKHVPRFEHAERVVCAAFVTLPSGVYAEDEVDEAIADLVDDMEAAIKSAILSSRLFAATFNRIDGYSAEKGADVDGETVRGHVTIGFRFVYTYQDVLTADVAPLVADDDFETFVGVTDNNPATDGDTSAEHRFDVDVSA
jgi:hypothetical protein